MRSKTPLQSSLAMQARQRRWNRRCRPRRRCRRRHWRQSLGRHHRQRHCRLRCPSNTTLPCLHPSPPFRTGWDTDSDADWHGDWDADWVSHWLPSLRPSSCRLPGPPLLGTLSLLVARSRLACPWTPCSLAMPHEASAAALGPSSPARLPWTAVAVASSWRPWPSASPGGARPQATRPHPWCSPAPARFPLDAPPPLLSSGASGAPFGSGALRPSSLEP
mmetsp:Transcript_9479/g.35488  ORF Transcript_9479/g.35488 Transcript_9479/m.35488 type:complete len:219 (-) Transcript_9479:506-1162(-)|eukprot:scaffold1850_cov194-Pinguiococcus_pyrenoidosus.AAC.28